MADILIYGEIGWDVTASSVREQLERAEGEDVFVHIDSPGGDAYEGLAMMNALRLYPGEVTTRIEGMAASAASIVAAGAGGRVEILKHAEIMVHEAWVFTSGTADDMTKAAEDLERVSENIATVYADRTGKTVEECREIMRAETWFTAEEAVAFGLADEVIVPATSKKPKPVEARYSNKVLARYRYGGRAQAPRPEITNHAPDTGQEVTMTDPIKALAQALGKTSDEITAAFAAIFDTASETKTNQDEEEATAETESTEDEPANTDEQEAEGTGTTESEAGSESESDTGDGDGDDDGANEDGPAETGESESESESDGNVNASADNDDYVLVPREHLDFLTKAAALATDAAERQDKADKAAEVDKWIADGRFSAALRSKALAAMERDPDTARSVWGSLPVNTINRRESGYGVDTTDVSTTADHTRLNELADKTQFATPDFY